jgi:hypothetical protein
MLFGIAEPLGYGYNLVVAAGFVKYNIAGKDVGIKRKQHSAEFKARVAMASLSRGSG